MDSIVAPSDNSACSIARADITDLFNHGNEAAEPLEFEQKELNKLVLAHLTQLKMIDNASVGDDVLCYDNSDVAVSSQEIMESVELIIDHCPVSLMVPKVVKSTCEFISIHTKTEGIFRKSGAVSRIRMLKRRIETETGNYGENDSVFDACSLLKLYLRELRKPVIPFAIQNVLTKLIQNPDHKVAVESLLSVIFLLPRTNAQLLIYLLSFLHKIAEQSSWNKMDVKNLALIFTPNFMHGPWLENDNLSRKRKTRNACKKNTENMEPYRKAIEVLIEYGDFAGWIPRGLQRYLNAARSDNQIVLETPKMQSSKTTFRPESLNRVIKWVQRISTPKPNCDVAFKPLVQECSSPASQSQSSTPPSASQPQSSTPPSASQPQSSTPPSASQPQSSTPPSASQPQSSTPPSASQPQSSTPPSASQPQSSTPPSASQPQSSTPPSASQPQSSTPPSASQPHSSHSSFTSNSSSKRVRPREHAHIQKRCFLSR